MVTSRVDGNVAAEKKPPVRPTCPPEMASSITTACSGASEHAVGLVIGVTQGNDLEVLRQHGADVVVRALAELSVV